MPKYFGSNVDLLSLFKNGKKEILPQGHEGLFLLSFRSVMVLPLGGLDPSPFSFCVRPGKCPSLAPLRAWCFHLALPSPGPEFGFSPRETTENRFSVFLHLFFFLTSTPRTFPNSGIDLKRNLAMCLSPPLRISFRNYFVSLYPGSQFLPGPGMG